MITKARWVCLGPASVVERSVRTSRSLCCRSLRRKSFWAAAWTSRLRVAAGCSPGYLFGLVMLRVFCLWRFVVEGAL